MIDFDLSVRLGDLLIAGSLAATVVGGYFKLRADVSSGDEAEERLAENLRGVQAELRELRQVVVDQARIDEQLRNVERRLAFLEK